LVDLRARQYDPNLGRFLTPDPLGPQDGNGTYVYVGDNPLGYTDPTGLKRGGCLSVWCFVRDNPLPFITYAATDSAGLGLMGGSGWIYRSCNAAKEITAIEKIIAPTHCVAFAGQMWGIGAGMVGAASAAEKRNYEQWASRQ
jgi:uncharacterized protein RhaS with RHS repeats